MNNKCLTTDEIYKLNEGQEVVVTWSGGNGPHNAIIKHRHGAVYAMSPTSLDYYKGHKVQESLETRKRYGFKNKYPLHGLTIKESVNNQ